MHTPHLSKLNFVTSESCLRFVGFLGFHIIIPQTPSIPDSKIRKAKSLKSAPQVQIAHTNRQPFFHAQQANYWQPLLRKHPIAQLAPVTIVLQ